MGKGLNGPKRNMIRHSNIAFLTALAWLTNFSFAQDDPIASVVKISVTVRSPDFTHPWKIDAAINPGNSGGPAITDNKVVGVAYRGVKNANNIGYLIHSTELIGFLKDIEDGRCDGKANLWGSFQTTETSALRAKLKLPKSVGGVMVNELREPENHPLHVHDVVSTLLA